MISPQTICKAITVVRRGSPWRIASAVLSAERSNRVQIEGNTQIDDSKRCSSHSNTKQTSANYLQSNNSSKLRESVVHDLHRFSSKHSNRVQIEGNTQINDSKQNPQTKIQNTPAKQISANYLLSNNRKLPQYHKHKAKIITKE